MSDDTGVMHYFSSDTEPKPQISGCLVDIEAQDWNSTETVIFFDLLRGFFSPGSLITGRAT